MSLAQFVGAFFTQPAADLQRNLTNLAAFRMILESHSLKTAFARFHLTTPQMLRELRTDPEAKSANRQLDALERELAVIQSLDRADFESLRDLGFRAEPAGEPVSSPMDNGSAAAPAPDEAASPLDQGHGDFAVYCARGGRKRDHSSFVNPRVTNPQIFRTSTLLFVVPTFLSFLTTGAIRLRAVLASSRLSANHNEL